MLQFTDDMIDHDMLAQQEDLSLVELVLLVESKEQLDFTTYGLVTTKYIN